MAGREGLLPGERNLDRAVVLNLGCTLESSAEVIKKKMPMPRFHFPEIVI